MPQIKTETEFWTGSTGPRVSPEELERRKAAAGIRPAVTAPEAPKVTDSLTDSQIQRVAQAGPQQVFRLIRQGTSFNRVAGALGMSPEAVEKIYRQQQALERDAQPAALAVRRYQEGQSWSNIATELKVSETEARNLYAQGHVKYFGANPAVQHGLKESFTGRPFPVDVYRQPTFTSDANRSSQAIKDLVSHVRSQVQPYGYQVETTFEADPMGGRHVVKVVDKAGHMVGQPFRLTTTPGGVPLVSKTGRNPGGYRLTQVGQKAGGDLASQLGRATLSMIGNHNAYVAKQAEKNRQPIMDDGGPMDMPDWMNEAPPGMDDYYPDDLGDWNPLPPPPPPPDPFAPQGSGSAGPPPVAAPDDLPGGTSALFGEPYGPKNVLEVMDVTARRNPDTQSHWKPTTAGDFMRLSHAGRFREERSESMARDEYGQKTYPEGLTGFTPVVSKGTVYPLEARNLIAGNIMNAQGAQWGSQKGMGKQMKRDELSLTRKYWQAGPALGVAYEQQPQHILAQLADQPEMAYTARAFVLDQGGIIPEGQMWKDTNFAPWVFGSFEQNPEKYELRFDDHYSEQEVLQAAGLWDEDAGGFKPRLLKPGDKVSSPSGFKKNILQNNEAGVITGYNIVDTMNERGVPVKTLRFQGYFGNHPNVASAMKLEGWKQLAQDKHVRDGMGIDADMVMNKPSDAVVANVSMLNALPRQEFEALWQEVHPDQPAPDRVSSMADLRALAPVWQRLREKGRATITLPGQVIDADTLKNYLDAGIIKDGKYEQLPPLFEGAEPQYRADLTASGSYMPVRVNFITDVNNLQQGHLSNEILRGVEMNFPGAGEHLREQGYKGRDIYHTLFEMHQLNTKPDFREHGTPVIDLMAELTGNKQARAEIEQLASARLQEILPESMQNVDPATFTGRDALSYSKFQDTAGVQAIQQYYRDALGSDSFIFKFAGKKNSSFMANPALLERFGFLDEMTNESSSQLKSAGEAQLKKLWQILHAKDNGRLTNWFLNKKLPQDMPALIRSQEELLESAGARKKWFGSSGKSMSTSVHASDYGLPRNSMLRGWEDIFAMTGLKPTPENRAYLNKLSRSGQLFFGGVRNPASDPIAQTGAVLNMLTPDIIKEAGLDIPTTGRPALFHPHQVQAQGGDNDSDQSQVYMLLQKLKDGTLANPFGLSLIEPDELTRRAREHAAGEYTDAIKKMQLIDPRKLEGLSPEKREKALQRQAAINILGFDPTADEVVLEGKGRTAENWNKTTLADYLRNSIQIGQAYNFPIRVGIGMAEGFDSKSRISEYGGWMYQNPLDKKNYEPGSPEADFFSFFGSFNSMSGSFRSSLEPTEENKGKVYYSYRQGPGFKNFHEFGAAGLLSILKRMTEPRGNDDPQAQMTARQLAGFVSGAGKDPSRAESLLSAWPLPSQEQLQPINIKDLKLTDRQQKMLESFAAGDSPLAKMMRGYGARNAVKAFGRRQREMQEDLQDPQKFAEAEDDKFANDLRDYMNILQNKMYGYGSGSGSPEFKKDYEGFLKNVGREGQKTNWFAILDPDKKMKEGQGQYFYDQPQEYRQKFYREAAGLFQKHVTGQGRDPVTKRWVTLDQSVPRNNPFLKSGYQDYDDIRQLMAINAQDFEQDAVEGWEPTLQELEDSQVTGPLVKEKYNRRRYNEYHEKLRRKAGYDDYYFAEGGKLTRPTKLGQAPDGRAVIGGEAGTEYVVPEGKTQDVGGGLKVFDEDHLGPGAPSGSQPVMLAKGGIIDYEAYGTAGTNNFGDAIRQVAYELSGGQFAGSVAAAKTLVRQQIEADIQKMAANGPQGGQPGLMASSLHGRATDMMSMALGPNPNARAFSAWNNLLGDYGLAADLQPLSVNPQRLDPAITARLQQQAGGDQLAYQVALGSYMSGLSGQLTGKQFSHVNYGNVYNAIPGWDQYWQTNQRPPSTIPTSAPSQTAQANLARLMAPPLPSGGGNSGGNAGRTSGSKPAAPGEPGGSLNEVVSVPKLTPQLLGEYKQLIAEIQELGKINPDTANKEDLNRLKAGGQRLTDIFKIAQRADTLVYQQKLVDLADQGLTPGQEAEWTRLNDVYGSGDPDVANNKRSLTADEKKDILKNISRLNNKDDAAAERYLFGQMEQVTRNTRERKLALTDSQVGYWDRVGLGYKPIDPNQLDLAQKFDNWFKNEFPELEGRIPFQSTKPGHKGKPTYLGGTHPAFPPQMIEEVLPQAEAARLKYEQNQVYRNLTPDKVTNLYPDVRNVLDLAEQVPAGAAALDKRKERTADLQAQHERQSAIEQGAYTNRMESLQVQHERLSALESQAWTDYEHSLKQDYEDAVRDQKMADQEEIAADKRYFARYEDDQAVRDVRTSGLSRSLGQIRGRGNIAAARPGTAHDLAGQYRDIRMGGGSVARGTVDLFDDYHRAMEEWRDPKTAGWRKTELADEISGLVDEMGRLKEAAASLTPEIDNQRKHLSTLNEQLGKQQSEVGTERSRIGSALHETRRQLISGEVEKGSLEHDYLTRREQSLDAEHRRLTGRYNYLEQEIAGNAEEMRNLQTPGLGISGAKKTPESAVSRWARRTFDSQNLFYGLQNMQQLQYIIGLPLEQKRQQYLASQFQQGQVNYYMNGGGASSDIKSYQANQAAQENLDVATGYYVNKFTPKDQVARFYNQDPENRQWVPALWGGGGKTAEYALYTLMGANMMGINTGGLAKGLFNQGRVGLGRSWADLGGLSGAAGKLGGLAATPAVGMGGLALGGIIAGGAAYDHLIAPQGQELAEWQKRAYGAVGLQATHYGQESSWEIARKGYAGATGLWGKLGLTMAAPFLGEEQEARTGDWLGRVLGKLGNEGLSAAIDEGLFGQAGAQIQAKYDNQNPLPVRIMTIDQRLKGIVDDEGQSRMSGTEIANAKLQYSIATGLSESQLNANYKGSADTLEGIMKKFLDAGLTPDQSGQAIDAYISKAPQMFGVYAGGDAGIEAINFLGGFKNMAELERLGQAIPTVSPAASKIGYGSVAEKGAMAQTYSELAQISEGKANQWLEQKTLGNQYVWSQAAYDAGLDHLALMDEAEPWRPKHQKDLWAIEDRRRQEDIGQELGTQSTIIDGLGQTVATMWSGGRQEQEIQWNEQRLAMEEEYWGVRRKHQLDDFQMSQKMFDFQIEQQEYNLELMGKQVNRAQQTYDIQSRQYDIQKEMFDLQTQWQREDFGRQEARLKTQFESQDRSKAIERQIFDLQTGWQYEDFDKQERRQEAGRAWQLEDQATNRYSTMLQSGWQEEDMQRSLRYATGRERLDIRRQMERQGIMNNIRLGQMDAQEDRSATQYDWQKEDLATARERYDIIRPLQRELLDLQEEYYRSSKEWALEDLEISKQRFEVTRPLQEEQQELARQYFELNHEWNMQDLADRILIAQKSLLLMHEQQDLAVAQFEEQWAWDEKLHDFETKIQEDKVQWAKDDLERARERAAEDEKMIGWTRERVEAEEKIAAFYATDYDWIVKTVPEMQAMREAAAGIADEMERVLKGMGKTPDEPLVLTDKGQAAQQPLVIKPEMKAAGGPTSAPTLAMLSEYGQEEYVVPAHGALIEKDQQTVQLLTTVVQLLGQIAKNTKDDPAGSGSWEAGLASLFGQVYDR